MGTNWGQEKNSPIRPSCPQFVPVFIVSRETINTISVSAVLCLDLLKLSTMEEKLKKILSRVYELYNKYGIKSVTMDDIARELGISKKTIYQYVKNKSELVELVVSSNTGQHREAIYSFVKEKHNAIDELLAVNQYINGMLKARNPVLDYDLKKYYPEMYSKLKEGSRKRMHESIRLNLIKGQKEGLYRTDMDVDIISEIHLTRLEYRYSSDSLTNTERDSEKTIREIFSYHLHGIVSEEGLKMLKGR